MAYASRAGRGGGGAKPTIAHPGFDVVKSRMAKRDGVPLTEAGAMLAAATRGASAGAKKRNPRLRRVK